jgi:hypothetical protein
MLTLLRRAPYVTFRMPLKFSATANRAEIVTLAVNNERLSDLFATKLHFAHWVDCMAFFTVHSARYLFA